MGQFPHREGVPHREEVAAGGREVWEGGIPQSTSFNQEEVLRVWYFLRSVPSSSDRKPTDCLQIAGVLNSRGSQVSPPQINRSLPVFRPGGGPGLSRPTFVLIFRERQRAAHRRAIGSRSTEWKGNGGYPLKTPTASFPLGILIYARANIFSVTWLSRPHRPPNKKWPRLSARACAGVF